MFKREGGMNNICLNKYKKNVNKNETNKILTINHSTINLKKGFPCKFNKRFIKDKN